MDFLFEIGLEEVPARMIAAAQAELRRRVVSLLERERLVVGAVDAEGYSSPRRLAVLVRGVAERQDDLSEEVMGPAVKIAFPKGKDAEAGPAGVAFAKKAGVEVSALKVVETPKGEYVAATSVKPGKPASEVIAAELPKELAGIYWAKNMYWRPGKPERFVRPVRWLLALLGDAVVPVEFGGYTAGRLTYGHRVLFGPAPIHVVSPESYLGQLSDSFVMADVELRRHTIRKALDRVCRTLPGTRWREDHALVDKMTHLTEWPSVIAGAFDAEYLELPDEVLVTVMRDHQNYFAVETEDGKLAPNFLAVLNTVADEAGEAVIRHGNERVLRARFNDARFFWEFDQRVPFRRRFDLLKGVTFQKDLGSYGDKTRRVREICDRLARTANRSLVVLNPVFLDEAAAVAKCDLTCELVKEFTELQGVIGGLYAAAYGYPEAVSRAIYDQYLPASMRDRIPRTAEGQVLAIADRSDTISGMFGLGMVPTGSKDPFALRRAANGIVKILAEGDLPISLEDVISATNPTDKVSLEMRQFLVERVGFYLSEVKGHAYDVVNSVLAVDAMDVGDAVARAAAVTVVRDSQDFLAVSLASKRMKNIVVQARSRGIEVAGGVQESLFKDPSESSLYAKARSTFEIVKALAYVNAYVSALEATATLRPEVDAFFESVMVMDPDLEVSRNRLSLLEVLRNLFSLVADFSEIVVPG